MQLVYVIGTYPEITTTFIDREIQALGGMGFQIKILSIRRPSKTVSHLKEYKETQRDITYLLPVHWFRLILAHLYFSIVRSREYFKTLFFILAGHHPGFKHRGKSLLHFGEGVYSAYLLRGGNLYHIHAHFMDRAATVALIVSRFLDIPYSVTAHADDIFNEPLLPVEKLSEAKFSVTVSEFNRAHLLNQYPRLNAQKLFVLHPWIDLDCFRPSPDSREREGFQILSVGRLVENKGHKFLIEACHRIHKEGMNFECNIIGDGPLRSELETLICDRNLKCKVHLLGEQPQSEVHRYLSKADVFVLACTIDNNGNRDGMPVAIAEAMAMEIPVISTDIVGIGEMVQDGTGYLVHARDSAALAESIWKVYRAGPAFRCEMGRRGRKVIEEHFDLYKGVGKLASLFERSISNQHVY
jgi:glycosyltransferase involved in cell wall biosynthesis